MDAGNDSISLAVDCRLAAATVTQGLERLGLQVVRSFDLQKTAWVARAEVPCPHHGTARCDCQLIVLLVYGEEGPPVSLLVRGHDNQTWFSVADDPHRRGLESTTVLVRRAFEDLRRGMSPPGVAGHAA